MSGFYYNVTLHSKFGEVVNAGSFKERDAERMASMWNLHSAKKGEWWVRLEHTYNPPTKAIYRAVISSGMLMHSVSLSTEGFKAFQYAFNLIPVPSKGLFIPTFWNVGGYLATVHSFDVEQYKCERRHYNVLSHKPSELDASRL